LAKVASDPLPPHRGGTKKPINVSWLQTGPQSMQPFLQKPLTRQSDRRALYGIINSNSLRFMHSVQSNNNNLLLPNQLRRSVPRVEKSSLARTRMIQISAIGCVVPTTECCLAITENRRTKLFETD